MSEQDIFLTAVEIADLEARSAYLDQACGSNLELRQQIEALLRAHAGAESFLNTPAIQRMPGKATAIDKTQGYTQSPSDSGENSALSFLAPPDAPGSLGRLGHYEVREILGRGAFGIVLKAFDEKLHRMVAIKVMSPELASTSPPRKRFLEEARAAAQIRHEHVVAVHAVEEQPIPYLVMEYIPGSTLDKLLNEHGPLDVVDVLRIGQQIASGLAAAHAQGLIHRDIKPANILLENGLTGRVKITDFGLARAADDASQTQSGVIAGTPMYMSPEQATSGKIDQRSDLFCLGSVLYVMTSGRSPFRAPSTFAVLKRVVEDTPRPISEIIAGTPDWLCAIIAKLQAKKPEERFSSAQEVADLINKCLIDLQANRPVRLPEWMQVEDEKSAEVAPPEKRLSASVPQKVIPHTLAPRHSRTAPRLLWPAIAAVVLLALVGLGVTEATGVTQLASTVIRLTTGSGTLVIETNDPGVKVTIDGEEVRIQGVGVEQLTLRPGQYKVAAVIDGKAVSQELVTITHGGKQLVRVTLEGIETPVSRDPTEGAISSNDPDRRAAEWVLSVGGKIKIRESGKEREINTSDDLPEGRFELVYVALVNNPKATNEGLAHFDGCEELTTLNLEFTPGTDVGLTYFKNCKKLTLLKLAHISVTDAGLAAFQNCSELRELELERVIGMTDAALAHFQDCKKLQALNLSSSAVTDIGLANFRNCTNLAELQLTLTDVTDAGLAHFRDCKNLKLLKLGNTKVTDAGLTHIQDCQKLTYIDLSGTQVTDAGLAHLQNWPKLGGILLTHTAVSDAGLVELVKLPGRNLSLSNTRVSKSGYEQLKTARPDLILSWSETNRMVAESMLALGGTVEIGSPGQAESRPVASVEELPAEFFQVRRVSIVGVEKPLEKVPELLAQLKYSQFDRLESLDLSGIAGLTFDFLPTVHGLRELNLTNTGLTDVSLTQLPTLPTLKRLILDGNALQGFGLVSLNKQPALMDLSLRHTKVTEDRVKQLAAVLPKCRIEWDGGAIEPQVTDDPDRRAAEWLLSLGIPAFIQFEDLRLVISKTDDLPKTPFHFTHLNLPQNPQVTDESLKNVRGCQHLQHVDLMYNDIGNAGLENFKDSKQIKILQVGGTRATSSGLAAFRDCDQLEVLYLGNSMFGDAGMIYFQNCKNLKKLYLHSCNVKDAGLANFSGCRKLELLYLHNTLTTDAALIPLRDAENLTDVSLYGTGVTDAGLEHVAQWKKLTRLGLAGTAVTDAGLPFLSSCRLLNTLDLRGTPVTDHGLESLVELSALQHLFIKDTKVTEAGVKKFAAALPKCRIEWDGGVIEPRPSIAEPRLLTPAERRALEWVIMHGGRITTSIGELKQIEDLPTDQAVGLAGSSARIKIIALDLKGPQVTDDAVETLVHLPPVGQFAVVQTSLTDAGFTRLMQSQAAVQASGLALRGTPKERSALAAILQAERISFLQLWPANLADADVIRSWQTLPLTRLELVDAKFGVDEFEAIAELHGLTDLQLTHVGIDDVGFQRLQRLTELTRLTLNGGRTDDPSISDEGLKGVEKFTKLTYLDLRCHAVTDRGIEHLKTCSQLQEVFLEETKVTEAGVKKLAAALPRCKIH